MKGIMFSDELIPLVIDGSKTMTRRIMKVQPGRVRNSVFAKSGFEDEHGRELKSRYLSGETVYVKEAWRTVEYWDDVSQLNIPVDASVNYRVTDVFFDDRLADLCGKWRNKMFMPEWASRCKIKITGVRAERLQDISEEDAVKEGINRWANEEDETHAIDRPIEPHWCDRCRGEGTINAIGPNLGVIFDAEDCPDCDTSIKLFANLIDRINGAGTWDSNPWVWVYEFEVENGQK